MGLGDANALTSGHMDSIKVGGITSEKKMRNVLFSFVPLNGIEEETKTFL